MGASFAEPAREADHAGDDHHGDEADDDAGGVGDEVARFGDAAKGPRRDVAIALPGGELRIRWPSDDAPVIMSGPAAFVFEGEWKA